ncbi:MAG: DUF4492 domain-containing protein [Deltaproteobacteria bacterium]|jgi:hypothetical protein|nr:DUF4492 domain-containing protein [Deltaproteobacteria bacterium]
MKNISDTLKRVYIFYIDGFKGMVLGKKLWKIILIKLFIMFAILKFFFFPDFLETNFKTDEEKSNYVLEQITKNTSLNTQKVSNE